MNGEQSISSISIMEFKGFIGDCQWNQRVSFERFLQFCIFFLEKVSFFLIFDFIRRYKQFIDNKNISHTYCFCDTCENNVLLAKCLNNCKRFSDSIPETPHDIV